jgi:signal transduction histidine kinase
MSCLRVQGESQIPTNLQKDVDAVLRIDAISNLLEVACRVAGVGFAAVARVTEDRWIACAVHDDIAFGLLPGGELKVQTTICNEIRMCGEAVVIDHVSEDPDFRNHPTPALYGFQSYISVPIFRRGDGSFFGTLCAIDPKPAKLKTLEVVGMFKLFADLIGFHLEAQERLKASAAALEEERHGKDLREQFMAVLGHDLRNPLAAVDAGTRLLSRGKLDDTGKMVVAQIQDAVKRMSGLIDNVLDLARTRRGDGITLNISSDAPLGTTIDQVADELRMSWPGRVIDVDIDLQVPVACDHARVGQLLSNLLGNALKHGADAPVSVRAYARGDTFELSVANQGEPIPSERISRLFEPFYRSEATSNRQGLGLGLYIAAEIARAHGGSLEAASDPGETRFTLRMPAAVRHGP